MIKLYSLWPFIPIGAEGKTFVEYLDMLETSAKQQRNLWNIRMSDDVSALDRYLSFYTRAEASLCSSASSGAEAGSGRRRAEEGVSRGEEERVWELRRGGAWRYGDQRHAQRGLPSHSLQLKLRSSPQNKTSAAERAPSSGGSFTTTACILPRSTAVTPPETEEWNTPSKL